MHHLADVMDILAELPSPEEVMALRPSLSLAKRISFLVEKKRSKGLKPEEAAEWRDIMQAEHLMRVAKARAAIGRKPVGGSK